MDDLPRQSCGKNRSKTFIFLWTERQLSMTNTERYHYDLEVWFLAEFIGAGDENDVVANVSTAAEVEGDAGDAAADVQCRLSR